MHPCLPSIYKAESLDTFLTFLFSYPTPKISFISASVLKDTSIAQLSFLLTFRAVPVSSSRQRLSSGKTVSAGPNVSLLLLLPLLPVPHTAAILIPFFKKIRSDHTTPQLRIFQSFLPISEHTNSHSGLQGPKQLIPALLLTSFPLSHHSRCSVLNPDGDECYTWCCFVMIKFLFLTHSVPDPQQFFYSSLPRARSVSYQEKTLIPVSDSNPGVRKFESKAVQVVYCTRI